MTNTANTLETLCSGHSLSESRIESLRIAIEAEVPLADLEALRDATRLARKPEITLPANRLEHLSRGRGWCRLGRGDSAVWAERNGRRDYTVDRPGKWTVGATDGFRRKRSDVWDVRAIQVGAQTWMIAD